MGKSGRCNKDIKIKNYGRTKNEKDEDYSFEFISRSVRQGVDYAHLEEEEDGDHQVVQGSVEDSPGSGFTEF